MIGMLTTTQKWLLGIGGGIAVLAIGAVAVRSSRSQTGFGSGSGYRITNQRDLRREFWRTFPSLPRKRITNYAGTGKMYPTDTRVTWGDWLDMLSKNDEISQKLAYNATLHED